MKTILMTALALTTFLSVSANADQQSRVCAEAVRTQSEQAINASCDASPVLPQEAPPEAHRCNVTLDCTGGPIIFGQFCDNGLCVWED